MGNCRSCDLTRIYKQFEERKRVKEEKVLQSKVPEEPIVIIEEQPKKTKSKKKKAAPITEKTEETIKETPDSE